MCVYRADIAMMLFSRPACYLRHTRTQAGLLCSVRNKKYEKLVRRRPCESNCMLAGARVQSGAAQKQRARCGAHAIKRWAPSLRSGERSHSDWVCEPLSSGQLS